MISRRLAPIAAVAAGGALGALLRVAFVERFPAAPDAFPTTTFLENVAGAFLLGLLVAIFRRRAGGGGVLYNFACTGLLGSFTTFSNFSVEIAARAGEGHYALALLYPAASAAFGLAAAALGLATAGLAAGDWGAKRGPGQGGSR